MTSKVQNQTFPFERLPLVLKKQVFGNLPANALATAATVSKTVKPIADDPQIWEALSKRLGFTADQKNPKEPFKQLPIIKLILNRLPPHIADPIKKESPSAQRTAILNLIEETYKTEQPHWYVRIDPFINMWTALALRIIKTCSISQEDKNLMIFFFPRGVFVHLDVTPNAFDDKIDISPLFFAMVLQDFDILTAFLDGYKKKDPIHYSHYLQKALRYVIHKEDPKFVKAIIEAGVTPDLDHISDAITVIAFAKDKEKMKLATAPIFDHFKNNPKISREIPEAENIANFLLNKQASVVKVQSSVKFYFSSS